MIAWILTPALALDLDEAREQATLRAVEVARAQAEVSRARGSAWITASGALPSVDLFANASTGAGLTAFGFERPVTVQGGVGLSGSWTLVAPGTWAAADAARHTVRGQMAMVDWARVNARRDATFAIADLWAAETELAALEDAAADAREASEGVESLVAAGLRPAADAARTRASAAALKARAVAARGSVAGRCAAVQALLRDEVTGVCSLEAPPLAAAREAEGPHPALVAADEALRAARSARRGALLDRGPQISATGTAAQYVADSASGIGWAAGVEARVPLVSGGAGWGANRAARAALDDAALALEAEQQRLAAARIAAEARWEAAQAGLEALEGSSEAADEALALVDARFAQGLETLEAWLAARNARDEARITLAVGRAERLAALAELESVRGVW